MFTIRFIAAVVVAIIVILTIAYFFYGLQPVMIGEAKSPAVEFKITKGEGFREIGARLSRESFIRSITVFKFYSILTGNAQKFQPGGYRLSYNMSIPEMVSLLTAGGEVEGRVTIPEGFTIKDIEALLIKNEIIKKEEGSIADFPIRKLTERYPFLKQVNSLEGFLFPDTYRFYLDSSLEEVLTVMLDNFKRKNWEFLETKENWYDFLILASLLEKEVPDFEERRLVAGILLKRLDAGMRLQADATISYAKCDGAVQGCEEAFVRREDVDFPSPYNTYLRLGWPPTPISNPGAEAVRAALSPEESSYWYYLSARETKETIFSVTLEEHNINRVRYLFTNQ